MSEYPLGCSLKIPNEQREKMLKKLKKKRRSKVSASGRRAKMAYAKDYLFEPGRVLTVAFKGGDYELHKDIARWAKTWEKYANIKFDFGHDKEKQRFRRWSRRNKHKKADIRISFESTDTNTGYWSAIGNDIDQIVDGEAFYPANIPTMNYQDLRGRKKSKQRAFVLHEFGQTKNSDGRMRKATSLRSTKKKAISEMKTVSRLAYFGLWKINLMNGRISKSSTICKCLIETMRLHAANSTRCRS